MSWQGCLLMQQLLRARFVSLLSVGLQLLR